MTLKTKLITSVSMFFMVVALLVVGVWAVSTAQVTMGGTISFNATNIYATITGTIEGASNAKTMTPLEYSAKTEPSDTAKATWCQDLTFADATIPTIKWTITIENKSERALYVSLNDNITSLSNATKTLTYDGSSYTNGEKEIPAKTSKVFTMEIKVSDTNASATVVYDFAFDLRDETAPKQILKQDENGFYVTMGTYNNSPVVWRLVGLDGEKFTGTTAPTSGICTFILENNLDISHVFDSDSKEYATSEIRGYLKEDYLNLLNLASDPVYNLIDARSISDLYINADYNSGDMAADRVLPDGTSGEDRLWLMSIYEVCVLLGGKTNGNNGVGMSIADASWHIDYHLRTYIDGAGVTAIVNSTGKIAWGYHLASKGVRPAFNLNLTNI